MKNKTKLKRHNFAFDEATDSLLRKCADETDTLITTVVKRGIELFAEKKGVKNEKC